MKENDSVSLNSISIDSNNSMLSKQLSLDKNKENKNKNLDCCICDFCTSIFYSLFFCCFYYD